MSRSLLVRGARQLVTLRGHSGPRRGTAMHDLGIVDGGAMLVEDGLVSSIGPASRIENLAASRKADELNADGMVVMPGFVDGHTHLIFGPPRLDDFEARAEGKTYAQIAAEGGGIQYSVKSVRGWTARRLASQAGLWVDRMIKMGTTTVEVKSGYGLDGSGEMKMLKVAAGLSGKGVEVVPTFLGAHVTPPEYAGRGSDFIEYLISGLMPEVVAKKLARFADVYCDQGAFTLDQARRYLVAAKRMGLGLRIHASQFANLGAVQMAVEMGASSVDHLEVAGEREIDALASSQTVATLLPGSVYGLGLSRYAPARALIEAGAVVTLATDFNPGTSPTCSMPMVLSLGCTQMKMTPAEALVAATTNAAYGLGLGKSTGTLEVGKQADFVLLNCGDYRELAYYFGVGLVAATVKRGEILWQDAGFRGYERREVSDAKAGRVRPKF